MSAIFLQGNAKDILEGLPSGFVQMVCTSPPYWGLRKYSGEQELIWGGDKDCEHQWGERTYKQHSGRGSKTNRMMGLREDVPDMVLSDHSCSLCGAWKGAYGLEPTPEMYVQHTIEILREVRRVLRKDGVVFWNIGDSYGSGKGTCFNPGGGKGSFSGHGDRKDAGAYPLDRGNVSMLKASGLKPKDLCLIPFRVALSAQSDGWWVRSVIIWSKNNPMPESVTDRPTESHEYIIMLTKSGTTQYWTHIRKRGSRTLPKPDYIWTHKRTGLVVDYQPVSDRVLKKFWSRRNLWRGHDYYWDADAVRERYSETERWGGPVMKQHNGKTHADATNRDRLQHPSTGRNIRSVWTFPTTPFPAAHFAVFPEKLPELCIKAATPEVGCCSKCGSPWERILDGGVMVRVREGSDTSGDRKIVQANKQAGGIFTTGEKRVRKTLGWRPTCKCNADKVPSVVLDPFAGAGTTAMVAERLGRDSLNIDVSAEYIALAKKRLVVNEQKRIAEFIKRAKSLARVSTKNRDVG